MRRLPHRILSRLVWLQCVFLVPTLVISQVIIRERIEISGAQNKISSVATGDTLPTLRFEYTTCCLFSTTILTVNSPLGQFTAEGKGGAVLSIPNAPGGSYSIILKEDVGWLRNVGLEAKERIYLDTTLMRSGTYQKWGGPGYLYWTIPAFRTPVKIRITLASRELQPLGDNDNKNNSAYNKNGPDTRKKIVDLTKVNHTPMTAEVSYHDGTPARNYLLTFRAYGMDTTGGHKHGGSRPGGRFLTILPETVYVMQQRTDSSGKVETRYFCSGFGGTDSIYVRGSQITDTATALVSVKRNGLVELNAGIHYKLIGWTPEHPKNHFGTNKAVKMLRTLADTVYAVSSWMLRINDISLMNGGPFDCNTAYPWNTPHQYHRQGASIDIDDYAATSDGLVLVTTEQLSEWAEKIGGKDAMNIGYEGDHFHLTVK